MIRGGGSDIKDVRAGTGYSAVVPQRVMVGTGSAAIEAWPGRVRMSGTIPAASVPGARTIVHEIATITRDALGTLRIPISVTGRYYLDAFIQINGTTSSGVVEIPGGGSHTFVMTDHPWKAGDQITLTLRAVLYASRHGDISWAIT